MTGEQCHAVGALSTIASTLEPWRFRFARRVSHRPPSLCDTLREEGQSPHGSPRFCFSTDPALSSPSDALSLTSALAGSSSATSPAPTTGFGAKE